MNRLKTQALAVVAERAWSRHNYRRSIALLTKAVQRDPTNVRLLTNLAIAHGKRRGYSEAERLLDRARSLAVRRAAALRWVAQAYAGIDRPDEALDCYRRVLQLESSSPTVTDTLVELASLQERRHQLGEAAATIIEALDRDPTHEWARMEQAKLDRRMGNIELAEQRFRTLIACDLVSESVATQARYELAQLLDVRGLYHEAYQTFLDAKRILRPHQRRFLDSSRRMLQKNEETLQQIRHHHVTAWSQFARHDLPGRCALLTSHPRSGTTLIEQVLDGHSDLISVDEFDAMEQTVLEPILRRFPPNMPLLEMLAQVPESQRQHARQAYWQCSEAILGQPIGQRVLLDKNPALTLMLPVITWAFPEMKLLIALRDPRDVILSCFMQNLPLNPISVHWLSLANAANYYVHVMNTWRVMRDLTTASWMEFRYEDSVNDLEAQARRLLRFLDMPWDNRVMAFQVHAREKIVRSPTYEAVTRPIYSSSVGRWRNYAEHFEPLDQVLGPILKEFGYSD